MTKSKLGVKGEFYLLLPGNSPSFGEIRAGTDTQASRCAPHGLFSLLSQSRLGQTFPHAYAAFSWLQILVWWENFVTIEVLFFPKTLGYV